VPPEGHEPIAQGRTLVSRGALGSSKVTQLDDAHLCIDEVNGAHLVRLTSEAGPAEASLGLDVGVPEFQARLRRVLSADCDRKTREQFGAELFKALFPGDTIQTWRGAQGLMQGRGREGIRLRLQVDSPVLAAVPWELTYDARDGVCLATSRECTLSRYLPVPAPREGEALDGLDVLLVVERPAGVPDFGVEEADGIERAMRDMGRSVRVRRLENATLDDLGRALQERVHVLHFLGHGRPGRLFLADDRGEVDLVREEAVNMVAQDHPALRLVVVTACASAEADPGGHFVGIGPALVRAGVPAVVAMQYPAVQVGTASMFSRELYDALGRGQEVDVAVNTARRAVAARWLESRDWSAPVLYVGTQRPVTLFTDSAEGRAGRT
jgi:hypothetical protein